jgi:hypothetical protein
MVNYWHKRAYSELSTDPQDLSKRGLVFLLSKFFTVPGSGSVAFGLVTSTAEVKFEFYDIATTAGNIQASLVEAPTATLFGSAIPGRNLNRTYSDTHSVVLKSASAVTGGTVIASELVGSGNKAGGLVSQSKIHTLQHSTTYVMSFVNTTNQEAPAHINLGWSEGEPNPYLLIRNIPEEVA